MRVMGSYALVYVLAGGGRFTDALGCRKEICEGDLVLIFPDVAHTYGPPRGGHWDEIHIVFEGPVFDLWRAGGILREEKPVYHLEPVDYWRSRFEQIVEPNLSSLERVCRLQSALAAALTDYQRSPVSARNEAWLAQARALLDAKIGEPVYVDDVARRLGVSPETFRKKFARLAGMSPWRYRTRQVIERACQMVHEGELTNKEIAGILGYNDEFHFSRRFKHVTGRSPAQFRALARLG